MDSDVTEENVQQLRVLPIQDRGNRLHFRSRKLPRFVTNLSKPKTPKKMGRRFFDEIEFFEWKFFRMLPLLRDNDRPNSTQPIDLPIDVQHLQLEKSRTIKRDNRP